MKFGTGILTKPTRDGLNLSQFKRLANEVAELTRHGHQVLVVTSGAVGAGMMSMRLKVRPADLPSIQACAAIGQCRLMHLYGTLFARYDLKVAQLLLTHQDVDSRTRYQNARNTLERLFRFANVIPIINENDSVAVEELKFGENDLLSAEVAVLAGADLLIILTSVDGLEGSDGRIIAEVADVETVRGLARKETGVYSRGGMVSKLEAMKRVVDAGIPAVIASGFEAGLLQRVIRGDNIGTRFILPT